MNKLLRWMLLVLNLLQPVGSLVAGAFGYRLLPADLQIYIIIMTLLYAVSVVFAFLFKDEAVAKSTLLLPMLTLIKWLIFLLQSEMTLFMIFCMMANVLCAVFLAVRYGQTTALIYPAVISAVVLFFVALVLSLLEQFSFGSKTVVMTLPSPDGAYYAAVIDSDQGALGGDTLVNVHKRKIRTPLFHLEASGEQVWFGDWLAYEDMDIYWKTDKCLVINGEEFTVD